MIKKFSEYYINESVLYFSPDFKKTLKEIDSTISNRLLELEGKDIKPDTTFIDFSDDVGFLKFQQMDKAQEKIRKTYSTLDMQNQPDVGINNSLYDVVDDLYKNNKNKIKTGRFLRQAMPEVEEKEIEKLSNLLTSYQKPDETNIRIVSGEEIKYWYDIKNYYSDTDGSLAKSCMARVQFFDLYTENPEVCRLVILTKNEKLIARALVWKLNSFEEVIETSEGLISNPIKAQYFLDRAYGLREFHENMLVNYAKSQGWSYREGGVKWGGAVHHNGVSYLKSGAHCQSSDNTVKYCKDVKMIVKIKKKEYKTWPHMDTFVRYDYVTGLLHNDEDRKKRGYLLNRTSGVYTRNPRNIVSRFGDFLGIE